MTTPSPREPNDEFLERHVSLDDRLDEAFQRYDRAFHDKSNPDLTSARIDLSLILWDDEEPPAQVAQQIALDGDALLRDTPPLS